MNAQSPHPAIACITRLWGGWLCLIALSTVAQTTPRPPATIPSGLRVNGIAGLSQPIPLEPYIDIFGDSTQTLDPQTPVSALPYRPFRSSGFSDKSYGALFWFRLRLTNTHPRDTVRGVLYAGDPVGLRLAEQNEAATTGFRLWPFRWTRPGPDRFSVAVTVLPGQTRTYYVQTTNLTDFETFHPLLFSPGGYLHFHDQRMQQERFSLAFSALIFGICLFLATFGLIMFLLNRDKVYAWWSLYLYANSLFLYVSADLVFNLNTLPYSMQVLLGPIVYLIEFFYFLFFDSILNLRKHDPWLHRLFRGLTWLVGILWMLAVPTVFTEFFVSLETQPSPIQQDHFFFLTAAVFFYVLIRVARQPIPGKTNVLIGATVLAINSILSMIVDGAGQIDSSQFWQTPHLIYGSGIFIELIFFSIALGQRALAIQDDYRRVEAEKVRQEAAFQLQLSGAEIAVLRAQMTPHFIFNCLNSIQALTNQNQSQLASEYLAKFARLIRRVLEQARSEEISLSDELETIALYLDMEKMRFGQKVRYQIRVDQEIDTYGVRIPPLLLQPFVENAIWHGLLHKPDGGRVDIDVSEFADQRLQITVTDDGVGRTKAAEYKSESSVQYKSYGTEVTAERIALLNQLHKTHIRTTTVDMVSPAGQALGTKVIIDIQH